MCLSSRRVACTVVLIAAACGGGEEVATENGLLVTSSGAAVVTLALIEGDDPIAIGVALTSAPGDPITVELAADPLVVLDRTSLTFTAENFDTPQPIVITSVDDDDVIDGAGELVLSAAGLDTVVLPVAIADDDRVAVVVEPDSVLLMEGDAAALEVALAADPGGPVTVTLAASDPTIATMQPATLEFTSADWSQAQTVTITGTLDVDDVDEQGQLAITGPDSVATAVPLVVLDVERQNLVIAPHSLDLVEGGAGTSFTVHLTQPPAGTFTVAVAPLDPAIATVSPTTLSFSAADHAAAQTVTVSPRADLDGTVDTSSVVLTADGLADRVIAITVDEDAVVDMPDVTGDFLMTFRPDLPEERLIRYRVTYTIDPVAGSLGYTAIALAVDDGLPVGDPVTASGVAVADDASFQGTFDGVLPAGANPISGSESYLDAVKVGRIVDADFLCGTMTGIAGALPLDGTTWASVRIIGDTLPDPVFACP